MPRASTSAHTLDSPAASASAAAGFRAPSSRSASRRASLNISRSRGMGKGKGKERAYDGEVEFAEWDEDGEGEGGYAPKARQLKVRKRRRSEGGEEGADVKRRKEERAEGPPEVEEKGKEKRAKRKKGKEKAIEAPDKPKKKSKKRVRIATPAPASSGGAGTDYSPSDADASDADLPLQALEGASLSSDDWTDPLGIPSAQTVRGRKYWRLLDQGIYRSALHDAAREGMDLGRALVQWEALRRRREEEEEAAEEEWRALQLQKREEERNEAMKRKDDDAADDDESQAGTPAPGARKKRPSAKAAHDPCRSLHPFPLSRGPQNDDSDDPRHRLEYDSDGAEILPLPSSVALAKMARWPLHSSVLGSALGPDSLEDALAGEYERVYRRTRPDPIPRLRRRGPRSAYGPDGPLAPSSPSAQPDLDSSTENDYDSDPLNSDADSPVPPPSLLALPSLLDQLLTRLADCVPKSAFPAYDYWSTRERDEEGRKDDRKRGVERDRRGVGWEEVVSVAREMGIDEQILETLSAQLVALFGPSRHPPVTLPPPGGYPSIQVKRRQAKPRASKKASKEAGNEQEQDDGAGRLAGAANEDDDDPDEA
ncbi:hypothetical protein NBRC10512v2_003079 [Rhodotorula toruloides]